MQPSFFLQEPADVTFDMFKAHALLKDQSTIFRNLMHEDGPNVIQAAFNEVTVTVELFEGEIECGLQTLHSLISYYSADTIRHREWQQAATCKALWCFLSDRIESFESDLNKISMAFGTLLQRFKWLLIADWLQPLLVPEGQFIVKTNKCFFWAIGEDMDAILKKVFSTHFKNCHHESFC